MAGVVRPDSKVLGVVVLVRHGDRSSFYQNAADYTPANTIITPLGNVQEYLLGQNLRSIYLTSNSSSFISTINSDVVDHDQILVRADGGGEGGVIFNSAVSLLQGLFPPTLNYDMTLANGTTIVGPMGGYQSVPIESVEPDNDISLEGWTDCNAFSKATKAFYNSDVFKAKASENTDFLQSLRPYLDDRPITFENMWNIFDYMNVQSLHNKTFLDSLPPTYLAQARHLANFHQYGVFSSVQPNGIGNIAGQTTLPSILEGVQRIGSSSDPLNFVYQAVSYKPFISLFNITQAAEMNPELAGIVNYAAAMVFEVRESDSGGEPVIRFNFKNGTEDSFRTYNFMSSTDDIPLSTFVNTLEPFGFDDLPTWCNVCGNTEDRGCAELVAAASRASQAARLESKPAISAVGAGFIGAGVTIVVLFAMLGVFTFLGLLTVGFGKRKAKRGKYGYDTDSTEKS